ncbi:MAG: M28 family peptidase, partial [Gemmatimonadota bacterium]
GRDPTGALLLVAHYDGVPGAPAAADDGAGVATILETLRALRATGPLRNDVVVLLSDGEELDLMGARAYAASPWPRRPSAVLNFEARGDAGPALMFETGPRSGPLVRRFAETPLPLASSLFQEIYRRMPNDTDFSVFIPMGLPGLNFANGERGAFYHTPLDAPRNLSPATLQHDGNHALTLVKDLGNADLATVTRGGANPVYFYVPGLGLIHYAVGWAVPLALLLVVLLVGVAAGAVRRRRVGAVGVLVGFVAALLATAAAGGVAAALWASVRGMHAEWGTLVGAALYREGPYAAAVVALGVGVVFGLFLLLRRWFPASSLALGALLLPAAVAVAMAFVMPRGSHVYLWPTAFALGMLAVLLRRPESESGSPATAGFMLVLAPGVLLLMAPLLWLVWVFLTIAAAPVIGVLAAVTALLLLPFLDAFRRPAHWWFPALAVVLAAVLVVVGTAGSGIDAQRPLADQLFYAVDRDSAQAWWATADPPGDVWSGRFVGPEAAEMQLSRLSLLAPYPGRVQPAPAIDRPGVRATVVDDRREAGRRVITLEVAWPEGTVLGVV